MPAATAPSPNVEVSGSGRETIFQMLMGRFLPAVLVGVFIVDQLLLVADAGRPFAEGHASLSDWLYIANRLLSLSFFTLLAVLFVTRLPARGTDRRPKVVLVAMAGSYSILAGSFLNGASHGQAWVLASDIIIPLGVAISLWSLAYLRRSFSIIPEARRLVTGGPYALSRNPLYVGEIIAGVGVLLPSFGPVQAGVLAFCIACQLLRIGWEEQVLEKQFPTAFRDYRAQVARLVPTPFARGRRLG